MNSKLHSVVGRLLSVVEVIVGVALVVRDVDDEPPGLICDELAHDAIEVKERDVRCSLVGCGREH